MLGTGIFQYLQAMRTLETHAAAQVEMIAERVSVTYVTRFGTGKAANKRSTASEEERGRVQ